MTVARRDFFIGSVAGLGLLAVGELPAMANAPKINLSPTTDPTYLFGDPSLIFKPAYIPIKRENLDKWYYWKILAFSLDRQRNIRAYSIQEVDDAGLVDGDVAFWEKGGKLFCREPWYYLKTGYLGDNGEDCYMWRRYGDGPWLPKFDEYLLKHVPDNGRACGVNNVTELWFGFHQRNMSYSVMGGMSLKQEKI